MLTGLALGTLLGSGLTVLIQYAFKKFSERAIREIDKLADSDLKK